MIGIKNPLVKPKILAMREEKRNAILGTARMREIRRAVQQRLRAIFTRIICRSTSRSYSVL